jgi:murein DD-endopeptidase MepM/ murein hydrolase activator NlpD
MNRGGALSLFVLTLLANCATAPVLPDEPPLPPGVEVVVAPGQTLTQIARETGSRVDEIVDVNGLHSPDDLRVGQVLFVPSPSLSFPPPAPPATSLKPPPTAKPPAPKPPTPKPPTTKPPTPKAPTTSPPGPGASTALLAWPVDGLVLRDFAPATSKNAGYDGVLIAAPAGTVVHAAAPGRVAFAGSQQTALGAFVIIEHDHDLVTLYAHLAAPAVQVGATVKAGDVIGVVGSTGLVGVSPRVQFQVRQKQRPIDPLPLLPP